MIKDYTNMTINSFKVVEDLGYKFATENSKQKNKFLLIECIKCNHKFETTLNNLPKLSANTCKENHQSRKYVKLPEDWIRIRHIHNKMIHRCFNEKNNCYSRYGAKGIKVCDEWRYSLQKFYDWSMNSGYRSNLTIDRINSSLDYFPENCRWATLTVQSRNKSNVISIDKVKEIKKLLNYGYTHQKIADMACTSKTRVSDISRGKTWSDIT